MTMGKPHGKNPNFGDLPQQYARYESASAVILPVPFDMTSSWMQGSDKGPDAIMSASANMELYDIESGREPYLKGIFTAEPVLAEGSADMVRLAEERVRGYINDGKFTATLGGEHTISLGPIKAHHARWPGMSVLHLDAHSDRRREYEGDPLSHACIIARVEEFCESVVSVGIRSMDASEREHVRDENLFLASGIHGRAGWRNEVSARLNKDVYITLDLDVYDPSIMPSTGTPEPGGLGWYDVLGLISTVAGNHNIVGMDVVELCPSDQNRAPDFLAAKLIYKTLSLVL